MPLYHILLIIILSIVFIAAVFRALVKGKLRVRYTMLWFGIGIMALASPALYILFQYLHEVWSFPTPSILLLVFAVVILSLICLQLTVAVSLAWRERKNLAQRNALMEQRIETLEKTLLKTEQGNSE